MKDTWLFRKARVLAGMLCLLVFSHLGGAPEGGLAAGLPAHRRRELN